MNILIFGGDLRQISVAKYLYKNGHTVKIYAIERDQLEKNQAQEMFCSTFENADAIVFPLPLSRDGKNVNCPLSKEKYDLKKTLSLIKPDTKVFAGLLDKYQKSIFSELKLEVTDYYDVEELQIKNSVPTAEGAIEIYMSKKDITVMGSHITVIGYGKVAKALAARLCSLGATVKVAARSKKDIAAASCFGCIGETINHYTENPDRADCIFNTVPHNIFDSDFAVQLGAETLFIDLASKPYGVSPAAAEILGERYIIASSLPGKLFPATAGIIIGETIIKLLSSLE